MYFDSFAELVYMAGHGPYVWMSYGISLAVLLGLYIQPLHKKNKILKGIKLRQRFEQNEKQQENN